MEAAAAEFPVELRANRRQTDIDNAVNSVRDKDDDDDNDDARWGIPVFAYSQQNFCVAKKAKASLFTSMPIAKHFWSQSEPRLSISRFLGSAMPRWVM